MSSVLFRIAAIAAFCLSGLGQAQAGELVGKPIKVNPPSDAAGTVLSAFLTIDQKGGFGAVWGKDTDGAPGQDALYARFYDKKGKAAGKPVRYDAKIAGKTTRAAFFGQPLLLGDGAVFQPWNAQFTDGSSSPLLAQLFKKQRLKGKYLTVSADNAYSRVSTQLRDGRGILTLPGASSDKPVGQFIEADGSSGAVIPFFEREFYGYPQSLKSGFIRTRFEDGAGTQIFYLSAMVYDASGAQVGGELRLTPDFPYSEIRGVGVIGLETGDLFVSRCTALPQAGRCKLLGQLFTKAGVAIGEPKVLLPNVSNYFAFSTHLPDGGFVLTTREDTSSGVKVTYYRFDGSMKAKGKTVEKRPGGNREDLAPQLTTDGRIVTGYLLDRKTVTLQVVEP